jgi:beta-1,4-mannooligosaccharide/beta-1,4-mannosyl-N-acetylglucosamine phosphorylase
MRLRIDFFVNIACHTLLSSSIYHNTPHVRRQSNLTLYHFPATKSSQRKSGIHYTVDINKLDKGVILMAQMMPEWQSSPAITRYNGGTPILTKDDIPYEAELIFNAGVVKHEGKYIMVFRDDYGYIGKSPGPAGGNFVGTHLGLATSDDGLKWQVKDKPIWNAQMLNDPEIKTVYDPRITIIDGKFYMCFAMDTRHGLRGGVAVTEDFDKFDILSLSVPDNRNMVLFPEKIGGRYVRLERPFPVYSRAGIDRFDAWMSYSPDLRYWGDSRLLFAVEDIPFANDKIGPGAPPVKTKHGWLTLFHSVHIDPSRGKNGWEPKWTKCYCAGIMLLDLEDPSKIIGFSKQPLIAPETRWEVEDGYRTNVIFPGSLLIENDGSAKIYYGASDTVECLALSDVDSLVKLCLE